MKVRCKVSVCWLVTVILCAVVGTVWGTDYRVEDVPMVHLQDRTRYVVNPDSILSAMTVYRIDTALYALEQETGIEVVVAALSGIEGGDCFNFALELGTHYGVGKREQNGGLVVLLVTGERCIQMVTGTGLEGVLPDALCKRIQLRHMNPHFAQGDWDKGMIEGMEAVVSVLRGSDEFTAPATNDRDKYVGLIAMVVVLGSIMLFGVINLRSENAGRKCPQCKKRGVRCTSTHRLSTIGTVSTYEKTYCCKHCGYSFTEKVRIDERDDDFTGPMVGGSFGSGMSSHSGGSFGGGSFSGGGAGSRF